jgi:SWI/SNF-related matrix-associated actin-dependent regulator 1 of chromatin subfamily A
MPVSYGTSRTCFSPRSLPTGSYTYSGNNLLIPIGVKERKKKYIYIYKGLGIFSSSLTSMELEAQTIEQNFGAFKPRNREILASLEWLARPIALRQGVPVRRLAAAVADNHPAWALWRLNRAFMEAQGFRATRDGNGDWFLELWATDETLAQEFRAASAKTTSDLVVPVPEGLALYDFQKAGVEFLATRSSCLLADEMGVGKSVMVSAFLNLVAGELKHVLVAVPASMKFVWVRELEKWLIDRSKPVRVVSSATTLAHLTREGIWIVNYERLHKLRDAIRAVSWDAMVLDEAHYLQSRTSQRTKACLYFAASAKRKILLTGTPLTARPANLWPLLNFLDSATWPNFFKFGLRYCGGFRGEHGWDFSGSSHEQELNDRLRSGLMLRRLKRDVLTQLPAITRALVPLEVDGHASGALNDLVRAAGLDPFKLPEEIEPVSIPFEEVAKIRHELGRLKVAPALKFIQEQAEGYDDTKFIVFGHHKFVLQTIAAGLPGSVLVTGKTAIADRMAAIDKFQSHSTCRFFVASIRAMGAGVALTAASRAIFVEQDWTPGVLRQAEDRLHRIGQESPVLVQYLVVLDSIDTNIMRTVIGKMGVVERVVERVE